jgi:hypothetical protein
MSGRRSHFRKGQDERQAALAQASLNACLLTSHRGSDGRSSTTSQIKRKNIMSNNNSKRPSHHVYTVRDGGEHGQDFWTRIGIAFAHNDGKGFSVILEALPVDGKLTIRTSEAKEKK